MAKSIISTLWQSITAFFTSPLSPPARWLFERARPEPCVRKTCFILGSSVAAQGTSECHGLPLT